jgi:GTP cyclohydrolase I
MMTRGVEKVNSKTTVVTTRGMLSQDNHAMDWLETIHEPLEKR